MTWNDMSPEAIELAFNPRATARNVDARVAGYAAASADSRARLDCVLDVRYGPGEKETLDIFPASAPHAPVQLFIHGGYWRAMDKSDYSFIADVFQPAGATTVLRTTTCVRRDLDPRRPDHARHRAHLRNIGLVGAPAPPQLRSPAHSRARATHSRVALAHEWTAQDLRPTSSRARCPCRGPRLRAGARHHGEDWSASTGRPRDA